MDKDKLITLHEAELIEVCGMRLSYWQLRAAAIKKFLPSKMINQTRYTKIKWIEAWLDTPDGSGGQGLPDDGHDVPAIVGGKDSPSPPVLPARKRGRGRPPKKLA